MDSITAGRDIWGFPKRWGQPQLKLMKDTLTGTLFYDEERVAMGTMTYKHESLKHGLGSVREGLRKLNINLKSCRTSTVGRRSPSSRAAGSRTSPCMGPGTARAVCT